jgi:hypothetical protein
MKGYNFRNISDVRTSAAGFQAERLLIIKKTGGTMKALGYATAIWLAIFIVYSSSAWSQEGYTFVADAYGQQVCIGRWIPSTVAAKGGVCEGEMIGLPQLTVLTARQSLDRLDQLLSVLSSISEKMDVSNDQLNLLIQVTANAQQTAQNNEALRRVIAQRFAALSLELTDNKDFREEISSLKEDVLKEIEKRYPTTKSSSTR